MKFFAFILITLIVTTGFSQTYKGKIIDTKNQPMPFVDIIAINSANDKIITGVNTNDNGNFELTVETKKAFHLEINFIGFKTKKITSTKTDLGTIMLKEQATQLKTVVIEARKKLIERKVDRLVFNVANSIQASAGDAMEVLKVTPSIRVRNDRITMIGKSGMQVMVNDRLIRLSGDDLVNYLASIPSDNIKNIEVITAPPAKYGANGNSGLININFKKTPNNLWNAMLWSYCRKRTLHLGSFGGNFIYNKNKFSLNTSFSYRDGDRRSNYENNTLFSTELWKLIDLPKKHIENKNTRIDINYNLTPKWSLGGQYSYNTSDISVNSELFTEIKNKGSNEIIKSLQSNKYESREYVMNSFNFTNLFKIGNKRKINLDVDYFIFNDRQISNYIGVNTINTTNSKLNYKGQNNNKQIITNFSTALDIEYPMDFAKFNFGGKLSTSTSTNGIEFFNSGLVNGTINNTSLTKNDFEYNENITAVYFSANKNLTDKLSVKSGVRMENTGTKSISKKMNFNQPINYTKWFPTFYLSYDVSTKSNMSLSYNKRIQRPNFLQLNPNERYSSPFDLIKGNAQLKPSFIDNLDLNYSYKKLQSKLYYNYENNAFSEIPIASNTTNITTYVYANYLNRHRYGISESYRFNKYKWWSSSNSIDFNYNLSKFNLEQSHQDKKGYNTTFSTNNSFVFNEEKTFKGGVNYWYNLPGVEGIFENKSASSCSLFLQYFMLDKNLRLTLRANDILRTAGERSEATINGVIQKAKYYYDSQYFQVSLNYKFGNKKIKAKRNKTGNKEERRRI